MSSDRVQRSRLMRVMYPDTARVVWLVCGWAAVAAITQVVYLLTVQPSVDTDLVLYLTGRFGAGPVLMQLSPSSAAIICTVLLVAGAGGAVAARVLLSAQRRAAYAVAVVALAIIAAAAALLVAGFIAALHNDAFTGAGLWGALPVGVGWAIFFSQLLVVLRRPTGKRVRAE
jgi:hypothetical protein